MPYAASLEVNHACDHRAVWVEWQILEPPSAMECAHGIVDRMRHNAEAADLPGGSKRRAERKQKQRTGMIHFLTILVDRELAEQCRRHRIVINAMVPLVNMFG